MLSPRKVVEITGGKWVTLLTLCNEPESACLLEQVTREVNKQGLNLFIQSQNNGQNHCLVEEIIYYQNKVDCE